MKKGLSLALTITMLLTLLIPSASAIAAQYTDINGHWAKETIEKWSEYEIIKGFEGKFRPDDAITRGEMAVVLDRLMDYQTAATNTFSDLGTAFYTDAVLKANLAGIMLGYNNQVRPGDSITRQDAFVMIARALKIQAVTGYTIQAADASDISDYAKASLASMESQGMVNGRGDGKLYPQDEITRAEVMQALENIITKIYMAAGTYSENATGYVMITVPDVVLSNMTIDGTLVIAPGVGDGDCTLDNVQVTDGVVVLGGGTNSVKFINNSTAGESLIVKRVDGKVRIFYENTNQEVPNTFIDDGCDDVTLEGAFANVTVQAETTVTLPTGTTVSNLTFDVAASVAGSGTVTTATVAATVTGNVSLQGNITNLEIKSTATVDLPSGTTVTNLTVEAAASITGTGTVTNATVTETATGASFETAPETTEVAEGATVEVAGEEMDSTSDDVADQPAGGDGGDTTITVSSVTLHFSDDSTMNMVPSSSTAAFDLTGKGDAIAITGITVTTSSATQYIVGTYSINTNSEASMSSMLTLAGIDSGASITLERIRALGTSFTISGTITGGSALNVRFNVASTGYYTMTNSGTTITALLNSGNGSVLISDLVVDTTKDPVAMLIQNLSDITATNYTLSVTKTGTGLTVDRTYANYSAISSFDADGLASIVVSYGYACSDLEDLQGVTIVITYGAKTATLIML